MLQDRPAIRTFAIAIGIVNVAGLGLLFLLRPYILPAARDAVSATATTWGVAAPGKEVSVTVSADVLDTVAPLTDDVGVSDAAATVATVPDIPDLAEPRQATFSWVYDGKDYELRTTLYGSLYRTYWQSPKVYTHAGDTPPTDWEEVYYRMFLTTLPGDNTIAALADDLRALGRSRGLGNARIAELATAFVQNIPYDTPKAQRIVAGGDLTDGTIVYPYETLYQNTGVCSDKSILLYALLRALGYGAALLVYDEQQHMAVGIKCPVAYGVEGSDYCYAETTATMPIGVIPSLESGSNRASAPVFRTGDGGLFDAARLLGQARIFVPADGATYGGMAATVATVQRINALGTAIGTARTTLAAAARRLDGMQDDLKDRQKDLDRRRDRMDDLRDAGQTDAYNRLVDDFNDDIRSYKRAVDAYNAAAAAYRKDVTAFNADVERYNSLIVGF